MLRMTYIALLRRHETVVQVPVVGTPTSHEMSQWGWGAFADKGFVCSARLHMHIRTFKRVHPTARGVAVRVPREEI